METMQTFYSAYVTIAQSLAAMMALLGAVGLFRLGSVESGIERGVSHFFHTYFSENQQILQTILDDKYQEFFRLIDIEIGKQDFALNANDVPQMAWLRRTASYANELTMGLRAIFASSSVVLVLVVGVIAMPPWFIHPGPLLATGWFAFAVCVLVQVLFVYRLLGGTID